jgi:hypothetical protein
MQERVRDQLAGLPGPDYIQQRIAAGWIPVVMEWERPALAPQSHETPKRFDTPYGFRVAADANHLEPDPQEIAVLYAVLEEIVRDRRFSQIADELNRQKLRTRDGRAWTSAAVFDLLPELIEAGSYLTKSEEWQQRRPKPKVAS